MSLVAGSRVWGNFEFDVIDVIRNPGGVTSAHATPSACLGIKMAAVLARPSVKHWTSLCPHRCREQYFSIPSNESWCIIGFLNWQLYWRIRLWCWLFNHTKRIQHVSKTFYGVLHIQCNYSASKYNFNREEGDVTYSKGANLLLDGGYPKTGMLIAPSIKDFDFESIRKDVECVFGILKFLKKQELPYQNFLINLYCYSIK